MPAMTASVARLSPGLARTTIPATTLRTPITATSHQVLVTSDTSRASASSDTATSSVGPAGCGSARGPYPAVPAGGKTRGRAPATPRGGAASCPARACWARPGRAGPRGARRGRRRSRPAAAAGARPGSLRSSRAPVSPHGHVTFGGRGRGYRAAPAVSRGAGRTSGPGLAVRRQRRNGGMSISSSEISSDERSRSPTRGLRSRRLARSRVSSRAWRGPRPAVVEAGGDDGHADLVAHGVVDDRAEDDVRVGVGGALDDLGRLVDLEEAEVAAAGDVQQDAGGALDVLLQQRAGDRGLRRLGGAVLAAGRRRRP